MKGHAVVRSGVVVGAVGALLLAATPSVAAATDGGAVVGWQVSQDGERPTVVATITNTSSTDWNGWRVTLPLSHPVSSVSGAISVQESDQLTLSSDRLVPAGDATVVQLRLVRLSEGSLTPSWCASPPAGCDVLAAEPPAPTLSPSASPSSSQRDSSPSPSPSDATSEEQGEAQSTTTPSAPGAADGRMGESSLRLSYRVARDWGSGQSVVMSVTNVGTAATDRWVVEIPADVSVESMWGAESLSGGGSIRAKNLGWNGYLAPGDTIEFGFTALPGRNPEWQECQATVDEFGADCTVAAADTWLGYPRWPIQW